MTRGGCQGKVLYIDTEKNFRPERIEDIAYNYNINPVQALENIHYAYAIDSDHQIELIQQAAALLTKEKYGLIIVDSVMNHFRVDYSGRQNLAVRQTKLGECISILEKYAARFGVAIVFTNQVQTEASRGSRVAAIGGNMLAHKSTTIVEFILEYDDDNNPSRNRACQIRDSPSQPPNSCKFCIQSKGIADIQRT